MEDDDALSVIFDVVLIGTGPVESILASSLSKYGKKVLHIEKNDYYGKDYACFSLKELMMLPMVNTFGLGDVNEVRDKSANKFSEEIPSIHNSSRSSKIHSPVCFGYLMEKEKEDVKQQQQNLSTTIHPAFLGYKSSHHMTLARALFYNKKFSIDLSFRFILSTGNMVDYMINSGVSKYLEFRCVESLYIAERTTATTTTSTTTTSSSISSSSITLVPCSKGDVFKTKLLSALEKRSLMKLLQLASDWGRIKEGQEVTTLNERLLDNGSALHRPQNKEVILEVRDLEGYEEKPFTAFLTHLGLSLKLQDLVRYALCLDPSPSPSCTDDRHAVMPAHTAVTGMRSLYHHMRAMGQYGGTAFLAPLYGVSEVPQAFCRICAVWGGIYVLRTDVMGCVLISFPHALECCEEEGNTAESDSVPDILADHNDDNIATQELAIQSENVTSTVDQTSDDCSPPVCQPSLSLSSTTTVTSTGGKYITEVLDSSGRTFRCRHVVCSAQDVPSLGLGIELMDSSNTTSTSTSKQFHMLGRSSVLNQRVLEVSMGVLIIPPNTADIDNSHSVFVVQVDSSLCVSPQDTFMLYISTVIGADYLNPKDLMMRVMNYLYSIATFQELYFVTTIKPLFSIPTKRSNTACDKYPVNLHITADTSFSLHMQDIGEQAHKIFSNMYPLEQFLPKSNDTAEDNELEGVESNSIEDEFV
eukprot:gene4415-8790_t